MVMPLFAHPSFFQKIAVLPHADQQAIYRCLEKLRRRQWDVGIRVKRLKGFTLRIWEARTDRGDRLIFTFGAKAGGAMIRVWSVVPHDDVGRIGRRNFALDVPFLPFLEAPETEEEVTPERCEQCLGDDLAAENLQPIDWDRATLKPLDSEEWEELLLGGSEQLEQRLTNEQRELVERPGSLLLSGTAGSGKTTVLVFRMLDWSTHPTGKALYLAYNPWLVQYARELFRGLLPAEHRNDPVLWEHFQFKSVLDLAQELLGQEPSTVGYPYFRFLSHRWPDRGIQPATAWSEIRSIIKGANLSLDKSLLDKEAYFQIGKKRAPDLQDLRPELFRLAQRYQKHLEAHCLQDELDLLRSALRAISVEARGYALILCDEVQDFTELHLELAFRLLERGGTLFGTGDLNQVINPSGFRWEEVRKQFFRRQLEIPQIDRLSTNFRSVGSIVELADGLLALRQRLLGGSLDPEPSTYLLSGDVPGTFDGSEEELLSLLPEIDGRQAILVRTEMEKDRLKFKTGCPFVFTIEEAKGLEFDGVLVWDFFQGEKHLWRKALRSRLSPKERPVLRYELNLLYVALTRPRRRLRFYDPDPFLWEEPELSGKTLRISAQELVGLANHALSPSEWEERGDYFVSHEFYDQAIACYERAVCPAKAHRARGRLLEEAEAWLDAAQAYRQAPDLPAAARMLERAKHWQEAVAFYVEIGEEKAALRCLAEWDEAEGRYREAGERWLGLEQPERAIQCIRRTKDPKLIGLWEAQWLDRQGDLEGAARCFERLGLFLEAADRWERLERRFRATESYRQAFEQDPSILETLLAKAEHNSSLQCALGFIQPEAAAAWFSLAAEGGHPEACYQLGIREHSLPHLLLAAQAGHLGALYELGERSPDGEEYYRSAAERGHAPSQLKLALLLLRKTDPESSRWLEKAAEAGETEAQFQLAQQLEERERYSQAFRWYRRAEQGGHPVAPYHLGMLALHGVGTTQNFTKAKAWFVTAAQHGHAGARFELGELAFEGENYAEAARWYRLAAEQDHAEAQYALGFLYEHGQGFEKEPRAALFWYQKAAKTGHVPAMHAIGELYYYGEGLPQDLEQAIHWYRQAAEKGNADSQYSLGFMLARQVPAEAAHWFMLAAEQGHPEAQKELGERYEHGDGVPVEPEQAVRWYRAAADQDHREGQYRLGLLLGKQNDAHAKEWLHRAAEKGHPGAMFELSSLYAASKDHSLAWCRKAAEQGHVDAQYRLGCTMLQDGEVARAMEWFEGAAEQGDEMSQYQLGLIWEEGQGGEVDLEKAKAWYRLAAARGEPRAQERLGSIER